MLTQAASPVARASNQPPAPKKTSIKHGDSHPEEFPVRPTWMTEKQWKTYVDWDANHRSETPEFRAQHAYDLELNYIAEKRIEDVLVSQGASASSPVAGQVVIVNFYASSHMEAVGYANMIVEALLDGHPCVGRVLVTANARDNATIFSMQQDRGQDDPTILVSNDY